MARTPLLRSIVNLAREHAIAKHRDVSVSTVRQWKKEAAERRRNRGPSRRDFLAGAGAAGAALAIPKLSRAAGQPRIAVVGGGIAGLSCALTLADAGLSSTVYESSTRLGGRMHSINGYYDQGQVAEWCGELIDTEHKTILGYAQRFRLPTVDLLQAEPNGSEDTYQFFGQYYPKSQADDDFQPVHHAISNDVQAASYPTTWNNSTAAGRALDLMSIYDWIESRVPGGHSSPLGQLLDIAYNIEFGQETTQQSSLNLLYLLAYQPKPGNFSIFGLSDERYHVVGGNQQIPAAIAGALGSAVKTGMRMTAIARNADGTFTLTFDQSGKNVAVATDYVVLCLPFAVLRTLNYRKAGFDDLKVTAITQQGAGRNGKLQLQFNTRWWNQTGPWPGVSNGNLYSDVGFQNTWDVTRGQPGTNGILVDYTGGNTTLSMTTKLPYAFIGDSPAVQADAERFLSQVEGVMPGLSMQWNGKAASSLPHLDPNLGLAYSYWKPGQYQTFAGYERVRQGNCLFAGEHCSIDFQGYMEGGASEGVRAANDILADLKHA